MTTILERASTGQATDTRSEEKEEEEAFGSRGRLVIFWLLKCASKRAVGAAGPRKTDRVPLQFETIELSQLSYDNCQLSIVRCDLHQNKWRSGSPATTGCPEELKYSVSN